MKASDLAENIGISREHLHKYIKEKKLSEDKIEMILSNIRVSKEDFYKIPVITTPNPEEIIKTSGKSIRKNHDSADLIPYYDVDFVAGSSIEFIEDGNLTPEYLSVNLAPLKGAILLMFFKLRTQVRTL